MGVGLGVVGYLVGLAVAVGVGGLRGVVGYLVGLAVAVVGLQWAVLRWVVFHLGVVGVVGAVGQAGQAGQGLVEHPPVCNQPEYAAAQYCTTGCSVDPLVVNLAQKRHNRSVGNLRASGQIPS